MIHQALPVRPFVRLILLFALQLSTPGAHADPPALTADEVARRLNDANLSIPNFRTTIVRDTLGSRPADDNRPWDDVPAVMTTTTDFTVSGGLLHAVTSETDTRSGPRQFEETWDGAEHRWKGVDPADNSVNLNIEHEFSLSGEMGMNETLRFAMIENRFPVINRLAAFVRNREVLNQTIEDHILTHQFLASKSASSCSVYTIKARLEPTFELLRFEMIIADTPDPVAADDHVLMKACLDFAEWKSMDGVRLPTLMYRDAFGPIDRERRKETMTQSRIVYRRTSFERLDDPPPPESMTLPAEYGNRVHDAGKDARSHYDDFHYTVGGSRLQYGTQTFELDDPILQLPDDDLVSLIKRGRLTLARSGPQIGVLRLHMEPATGGPGDAVRAALRTHDEKRPVVDPKHTAPTEFAAIDHLFHDWHTKRVKLIGDLWEAEPDAPELPRLLLDRWKYADLVPDVDVAAEIDRFATRFPDQSDVAMVGRYWQALHTVTRPNTDVDDRRAAIEQLKRGGAHDALVARIMLLASLAANDPVQADQFQRMLVNTYPDTYDARSIDSQLRSTEALNEIADFSFIDLRTGKKMSIRDFRGSVVAVNFWATWCGPCMQSMPHYREHYDELKEKYGDRFEMIGVSLDADPKAALEYAERENIPWIVTAEPNAGWDNSIARLYGVTGIPRTIIIGTDGRVRRMQAEALNFLVEEVKNVFYAEEAELKAASKESGD